MELPIRQGAGTIVFFKSVGKMLAAVITGRKSDICNAHGAVYQKKGGFLQPFFVYIFNDAAAQDPGKKGLEIGFIDPGIGGQFRYA